MRYLLATTEKVPEESGANSMPAGPEIELKFLFAAKDLAKVKDFVAALSGKTEERCRRLRTIYFDTPTQDLWREGLSLRVRQTGTGYFQGIKKIAPSSVERDEWEEQIGGPEPSLRAIHASPFADLAREPSIGRALRPVFEVDVERSSLHVASGGGLVEVSLDEEAIKANGESIDVREAELELKSGEVSVLFGLARSFLSQAPVHLSFISKAERGHLLSLGNWGRASKACAPRLDKGATCRQAFKEICRACLHDFQLNMPALETADTVEGVHQARVALRRLRAAVILFKPMVADAAYRRLRGELQWLGRLLGTVRDLDVLQANLSLCAGQSETSGQARKLIAQCQAKRQRAHRAAMEAFSSDRGRILPLDLVEWVETGQWQNENSSLAEEPVRKFARAQLKKRWKKLVKDGTGLAKLGPAARHQIRIEAKRLRYMAEFFAAAPSFSKDREGLKALIGHCRGLQDALGTIRDEEATAEFLQTEAWAGIRAVPSGTGPATFSAEHKESLARRIAKELRRAERHYSRLARAKPF